MRPPPIAPEYDECEPDPAQHIEALLEFVADVDRGAVTDPGILGVVRDVVVEKLLPAGVRRAERDRAILALDSWLSSRRKLSFHRRATVIEEAARGLETRGSLPTDFYGFDAMERATIAELGWAALRWDAGFPGRRQLQNLLRL